MGFMGLLLSWLRVVVKRNAALMAFADAVAGLPVQITRAIIHSSLSTQPYCKSFAPAASLSSMRPAKAIQFIYALATLSSLLVGSVAWGEELEIALTLQSVVAEMHKPDLRNCELAFLSLRPGTPRKAIELIFKLSGIATNGIATAIHTDALNFRAMDERFLVCADWPLPEERTLKVIALFNFFGLKRLELYFSPKTDALVWKTLNLNQPHGHWSTTPTLADDKSRSSFANEVKESIKWAFEQLDKQSASKQDKLLANQIVSCYGLSDYSQLCSEKERTNNIATLRKWINTDHLTYRMAMRSATRALIDGFREETDDGLDSDRAMLIARATGYNFFAFWKLRTTAERREIIQDAHRRLFR